MLRFLQRSRTVVSRRQISKGFSEAYAKSVKLRQDLPEYNHITTFENVFFPPNGEMLLPEMPAEPTFYPHRREEKRTFTKRMIEVRGVENIHVDLIHKQYGLAAVTGGFLTTTKFAFLRDRINRNLKPNQFAIWRADPPWLPRTKRANGTKMGGGKAPINQFVTPVRPGRIILELGGHVTEMEARGYLSYFDSSMTFKVEFVSQELLQRRRNLETKLKGQNANNFDWDTVIKYNMQNCYRWLSPYDIIWKGKYK